MPREIIVDWTTPAGGGKVSVLWFDLAGNAAIQRGELGDFLGQVDQGLSNQVTWTIRTAGRDLNDATGALVGAWADGTTETGVGNNALEPVADATQILFQWLTGSIVNGRFLRGRTFIPGLPASSLDNGNLSAASNASFQGIADSFLTASETFGVWHRPTLGAGGVFELAQEASVWAELAVLRRRRG